MEINKGSGLIYMRQLLIWLSFVCSCGAWINSSDGRCMRELFPERIVSNDGIIRINEHGLRDNRWLGRRWCRGYRGFRWRRINRWFGRR